MRRVLFDFFEGKRDFRIVVLVKRRSNKYVILASTEVGQSIQEVVSYYRLRFQVEFLFRDAKPFAGLAHCQARDQAKLDFHFNMSMAAVCVGAYGRFIQQLCAQFVQPVFGGTPIGATGLGGGV